MERDLVTRTSCGNTWLRKLALAVAPGRAAAYPMADAAHAGHPVARDGRRHLRAGAPRPIRIRAGPAPNLYPFDNDARLHADIPMSRAAGPPPLYVRRRGRSRDGTGAALRRIDTRHVCRRHPDIGRPRVPRQEK